MPRRHLAFLVGIALLTLAPASATEQWPQFRGSKAGVADDHPTLPDTWSETENVVWATTIPGQSWSSPIVWEDHVFVTTAISGGVEPAPTRGLADPTADDGRTKRWFRKTLKLKRFGRCGRTLGRCTG